MAMPFVQQWMARSRHRYANGDRQRPHRIARQTIPFKAATQRDQHPALSSVKPRLCWWSEGPTDTEARGAAANRGAF